MWRKERVEWTVQRDGIGLVSCPASDLLAEIFFTTRAEIFLKTKQKYFPTAFKLSWCDGEVAGGDPVIRVSPSTPAALWCPPAWLATTRRPPSTPPLSTATKVRSPAVRLELWPHLTVFRWPQTGGLGRSSVPASSSPTTTAGPGISVREIQLLRY